MDKNNIDKTTMQFRIASSDKDKIIQRANAAQLSISSYIRTVALYDDKVTFLNQSGSIAKSLAEISTNLDRALRGKEIKSDLEEDLLNKFNLINDDFVDILEQISKIKLSDEGGD